MIVQLIIFFALLILLFIISRKVTNFIYLFCFLLTKHAAFSISLLALILLPGTIIHELSHFVTATILRVPTGKLSILPKIENKEQKKWEVKTGKVSVSKTDPIRYTLIGISPIIIGLVAIYTICHFFNLNISTPTTYNLQPTTMLIFYLLFAISNTMFPSKKDLEDFWIVVVITGFMLFFMYFAGIKVFFTDSLLAKSKLVFTRLNYFLLITVVINYSIALVFALFVYILQKILKIKIG